MHLPLRTAPRNEPRSCGSSTRMARCLCRVWSAWSGSNRRSPVPKTGAIPLRYTLASRAEMFRSRVEWPTVGRQRHWRSAAESSRAISDLQSDALTRAAELVATRRNLECGARIELASLAWKARAHPTRPTARLVIFVGRPNLHETGREPAARRRATPAFSARRGDRTHLQQIKDLLPHQSAWRAWSSREKARARSSHHVDYSIIKVAITRW